MDICYDNSCPPYFNGKLRVRIGFAGTIVVCAFCGSCVLVVRIPWRTCEYRLIKDARHSQ